MDEPWTVYFNLVLAQMITAPQACHIAVEAVGTDNVRLARNAESVTATTARWRLSSHRTSGNQTPMTGTNSCEVPARFGVTSDLVQHRKNGRIQRKCEGGGGHAGTCATAAQPVKHRNWLQPPQLMASEGQRLSDAHCPGTQCAFVDRFVDIARGVRVADQLDDQPGFLQFGGQAVP